MVAAEVLATVEQYRESLEKAVDAGPAPIQMLVFFDSEEACQADYGTAFRAYETVVLMRRRYAMPAPWAVRRYSYIANVFVLSSEPDTPLVYGEWHPVYHRGEILDLEIPPHRH